MKTILKVLVVLLVLLLAMPTSAQKKWEVGGGLMVGVPTGNFSDFHKLGIGVSGAVCYATSPEISVTGRIGYMSFSGKTISEVIPFFGTITFDVENLKMIPIVVGGRYYSKPGKTQFFGSGEAGLYLLSNGNSETKFGIAPGAGVRFNMDEKYHIDVQGRYELVFTEGETTSFIGARASVYFDLQ